MSTAPPLEQAAPVAATHSRLEHFPVSFFAIVMGLLGLTLSIHVTETRFGMGNMASITMLTGSILVFAAIAATYLLKALRYWPAVRDEWRHPVRIAFFPAMSISLLLMAAAFMAPGPAPAHILWLVGVALQAVMTLSVIANWIGYRAFQPAHLSPAWFIPAVGNMIVPLAGARLGYTEIS